MSQEPLPIDQTPLRRNYSRNLSLAAPFGWLKVGLRDTFLHNPLASFAYGILVFLASVVLIGGLIKFGMDYLLLPALAGFMVVGPAIAIGLYEKSRRIESGERVSLLSMVFVKSRSPGQILFVGVLLMLIMLLWMRAAFLLYALIFGMVPFSGFDQLVSSVLTTPRGWLLLFIGSAVGGLFAAFSFAISAFAIPMLLNERTDAFTAMGTSMAMAWNNKGIAIVWGIIVMSAFAFCLTTALVGLIIVFPLLGHATWHAYREVAGED